MVPLSIEKDVQRADDNVHVSQQLVGAVEDVKHFRSRQNFNFPYPAPEGKVWLPGKYKKIAPKLIDAETVREHPEYYFDRSIENAEIAKGVYRPFPKRSFLHRIYDEEKRVRRLLPVPLSLTGFGLNDGRSSKFWRARIARAIRKIESETEIKSDVAAENITPALKILLDKFPDKISSDYNEIKRLYEQHKNRNETEVEQVQKRDDDVSFPFAMNSNVKERLIKGMQCSIGIGMFLIDLSQKSLNLSKKHSSSTRRKQHTCSTRSTTITRSIIRSSTLCPSD